MGCNIRSKKLRRLAVHSSLAFAVFCASLPGWGHRFSKGFEPAPNSVLGTELRLATQDAINRLREIVSERKFDSSHWEPSTLKDWQEFEQLIGALNIDDVTWKTQYSYRDFFQTRYDRRTGRFNRDQSTIYLDGSFLPARLPEEALGLHEVLGVLGYYDDWYELSIFLCQILAADRASQWGDLNTLFLFFRPPLITITEIEKDFPQFRNDEKMNVQVAGEKMRGGVSGFGGGGDGWALLFKMRLVSHYLSQSRRAKQALQFSRDKVVFSVSAAENPSDADLFVQRCQIGGDARVCKTRFVFAHEWSLMAAYFNAIRIEPDYESESAEMIYEAPPSQTKVKDWIQAGWTNLMGLKAHSTPDQANGYLFQYRPPVFKIPVRTYMHEINKPSDLTMDSTALERDAALMFESLLGIFSPAANIDHMGDCNLKTSFGTSKLKLELPRSIHHRALDYFMQSKYATQSCYSEAVKVRLVHP